MIGLVLLFVFYEVMSALAAFFLYAAVQRGEERLIAMGILYVVCGHICAFTTAVGIGEKLHRR